MRKWMPSKKTVGVWVGAAVLAVLSLPSPPVLPQSGERGHQSKPAQSAPHVGAIPTMAALDDNFGLRPVTASAESVTSIATASTGTASSGSAPGVTLGITPEVTPVTSTTVSPAQNQSDAEQGQSPSTHKEVPGAGHRAPTQQRPSEKHQSPAQHQQPGASGGQGQAAPRQVTPGSQAQQAPRQVKPGTPSAPGGQQGQPPQAPSQPPGQTPAPGQSPAPGQTPSQPPGQTPAPGQTVPGQPAPAAPDQLPPPGEPGPKSQFSPYVPWPTAKLRVRVIDGRTLQPLPGAEVVVIETEQRITTDQNGYTPYVDAPIIRNPRYRPMVQELHGQLGVIAYKNGYRDSVHLGIRMHEGYRSETTVWMYKLGPGDTRVEPVLYQVPYHHLWLVELADKFRSKTQPGEGPERP